MGSELASPKDYQSMATITRVPVRLGPSRGGLVELIAGCELCWATRAARCHARATRATLNRICPVPHLDSCAHRPPTGHPGASNWSLAAKPNPKRRDALFILCKLHSSLPINCIALHSENVCDLSGFNACHQLLRQTRPISALPVASSLVSGPAASWPVAPDAPRRPV